MKFMGRMKVTESWAMDRGIQFEKRREMLHNKSQFMFHHRHADLLKKQKQNQISQLYTLKWFKYNLPSVRQYPRLTPDHHNKQVINGTHGSGNGRGR